MGSSLTSQLQQQLAGLLIDKSDLIPVLETPAGVEATWRGDSEVLYLLNHNNKKFVFELDKTYRELITDQTINEVELSAYGVMVLKPLSVKQ